MLKRITTIVNIPESDSVRPDIPSYGGFQPKATMWSKLSNVVVKRDACHKLSIAGGSLKVALTPAGIRLGDHDITPSIIFVPIHLPVIPSFRLSAG